MRTCTIAWVKPRPRSRGSSRDFDGTRAAAGCRAWAILNAHVDVDSTHHVLKHIQIALSPVHSNFPTRFAPFRQQVRHGKR
jgi:hypothetical protein